MNHQGSIILMLFVFIMTTTSIFYSLIRTNSYIITIANERYTYETCYQLACGLQKYALIAYQNYNNSDNQFANNTILFKEPWPDKASKYEGCIWLEKIKQSKEPLFLLHTDIRLNGKTLVSLKV